MQDHDLLSTLTAPARARFADLLAAHHLPPPAIGAVVELLDAGYLVLLMALLARAGARLLGATDRPADGGAQARPAVDGVFVGSALLAATLLAWIVRFPSRHLHEVFGRGDHLAFSLFAGCALARLGEEWRRWALIALSLGMLWQYSGPLALLVVMGAGLLGFAALGPAAGRRPSTAVAVQAAIIAAVYGLCWKVRAGNPFQALYIHGLSFFLFLRHISFAVDVCRGSAASLSGYLCFMSFYPGSSGPLGSPEVYHDFTRRNLSGRSNHDYQLAVRKVADGALRLWAVSRVPASLEIMLASPTTGLLWMNSLLLFVRVALEATGFWALIEATALLYGFRLQPNFKGVLTRQNPSELWWAWRGSLTNWLVRYVYGPLGANRRHQSLNILATFGASMLWHWMAVPFLTSAFGWRNLIPITAWFALNGVAVVGHVHFQRQGYRILPPATPSPLRRATKVFLTGCLGASCATLPHFQGELVGRFPAFVRMLLGVQP